MPARLHRELIGDHAAQLLLLTHGIFGSGTNWRTIARKVHERRPEWGIVLVDLRQHGRSDAGKPPHDLAACAQDLRVVLDELHGIEAVAGHSFGGKVALAMRAIAPKTLRQTWLFDASPSARPDPDNTVTRVLDLMERLPKTWSKRDDFIAAVVEDGHSHPFAQWLAMNVTPRDDGTFGLRLDLAALRAMLADYYARDLWSVAFDASLPGDVDFVIAERATTLDEADRERLLTAPPHVHVERIDAGHWLHIDAPANVVELLVRDLPTPLR